MLQVPCYLDSAELADLRRLFQEGVQRSDVIVFLGSAGVLSRPWCLLELHEAMEHDIPIIFLPLEGRGFTLDSAIEFVSDLETRLEQSNPSGLREVQDYLGGDLSTYKKRLVSKLEEARRNVTFQSLKWEPNGTDNALLANAHELCDAMALMCGHTLKWEQPQFTMSELEADDDEAEAPKSKPSGGVAAPSNKKVTFNDSDADSDSGDSIG